jgi:hypothetical protein
MGCRKRNRLLDVEKLLWLLRCGTLIEFQAHFKAAWEHALINRELERQAEWTQEALSMWPYVSRISR